MTSINWVRHWFDSVGVQRHWKPANALVLLIRPSLLSVSTGGWVNSILSATLHSHHTTRSSICIITAVYLLCPHSVNIWHPELLKAAQFWISTIFLFYWLIVKFNWTLKFKVIFQLIFYYERLTFCFLFFVNCLFI